MAVDGGATASILAGVFAIVSSGMGIWAADRRAVRKERAEIRAAEAAARDHRADLASSEKSEVLERSDEITRYIRAEVQEATKELRGELAQVKRLVGSIYGRLSRTREAFREYIWDVRRQWGKAAEPPPLSTHALELLGDDDLDDTFTAEQIAEIIDPDRSTAS